MIKNIIFDFGNVLGTFDFETLMKQCGGKVNEHTKEYIFHNWETLDAGMIEYDDYMKSCLQLAPVSEHENMLCFFKNWYKLLPPIQEIHNWIPTLKKQGYQIFLLSNAPLIFEQHASNYPILKYFDGIVFSGSTQMMKPDSQIYHYLLHTYHLNASECFFIDDRIENIEAAKAIGMQGMVYSHNLNEIIKSIA